MSYVRNGSVLLLSVWMIGCGRAADQRVTLGAGESASPVRPGTATAPHDSTARWLVEQTQDKLTDKPSVTGTIAFKSVEAGRYEFSIVLDGRQDFRGNELATLKAVILDAEPTGLTVVGNGMQVVKAGTKRLDQETASQLAWYQSPEFRNVFTADLPAEELVRVKQRILVTGLRSADEVFELPRNSSSEPLWTALAGRVKAADNRKTDAVEQAEASARARTPGLVGNRTNQRWAVSPDAAVRLGFSKEQVYEVIGGPVMASTSSALTEWHYCETGEYSSHLLRTIFFVDGRVVGDVRYSAPYSDDCTEKVKAGSYEEPEAIVAIRAKQ